jgi:hypothetical protein
MLKVSLPFRCSIIKVKSVQFPHLEFVGICFGKELELKLKVNRSYLLVWTNNHQQNSHWMLVAITIITWQVETKPTWSGVS